MGLFDARHLFEITHSDYPNERLVVYRNEARGRLRAPEREALLAAEAVLDGLCVIRSALPVREMASAALVRTYKALTTVERAFRTLKTVKLKIRPIYHCTENRVRVHIFVRVLAYYVE